MKYRCLRRQMQSAFLVLLIVQTACSGQNRHDDGRDAESGYDASPDGGADAGERDARAEADVEWPTYDGDIDSPEMVPNCGDGVLDPGEECDDGNRLNGDGCDWICRDWDGERPPRLDPTVEPYVPGDDPVSIEGTSTPTLATCCRIPLTWSGEELASVQIRENPPDFLYRICFDRFELDGTTLDSDWDYPYLEDTSPYQPDLVWTGSEYGLFYWMENGVFFLRLNADGKPMGDPVLVVDDPNVYAFAADRAADGYVLTWKHCEEIVPRYSWECSYSLRLVGSYGETEGMLGPLELVDPLILEEQPETYRHAGTDVATGPNGFGVVIAGPPETTRFVRVNEDLTNITTSGILAEGNPGEVLWNGDDSYVTAWTRTAYTYLGTCIARFDSNGMLRAAPVCSEFLESSATPPRLAVGDGGLALVFRSSGRSPTNRFVRTDAVGVPLGTPIDVFAPRSSSGGPPAGPAAIVWADEGFAVLYSYEFRDLAVRLFVRESP